MNAGKRGWWTVKPARLLLPLVVLTLIGSGVVVWRLESRPATSPVTAQSHWPPEKLRRLAAEEARRNAAKGRPLREPDNSRAPEVTYYSAGIQANRQGAPFRVYQFIGSNLWNGPVADGSWEVVQAGGVPTNVSLESASPTSAAVFVDTQAGDHTGPLRVIGVIKPPVPVTGPFTIEHVVGDVLTLRAPHSAKTYHFNVDTLRYSV